MSENTYGHTPVRKAFDQGDVYGVGYDVERAARKKVRLGFIGAGPVVQSKHWPAIKRLQTIWEPVEVPAFALRTKRQGEKVQEVFGGRWYADYHQMLEHENLDGVIICSSDSVHAEHAMAAMEKGLHVLVEKPITRSLTEAEAMCRLADEKGLVLMTVANKRFSPPYRRAKNFVTEGPVTNPALYIGKFNLGYSYVDLFESGTIHIFDITRFLMGDVASVRCVGLNRYHRNKRCFPIDNAISQLEFTSGAVGTVYSSSSALSLKPWERVEVYGDHAWIEVDDQYKLTLYDSETGPTKSWTPVIPNTLLFDEEFGGFTGLIENFLQAIRGGAQPLVTGWDGYRAYEMLVASELSLARNGEIIKLPLKPKSADEEAHAWLERAGWPGQP
jgi:predicted dehydrogenase